jgi:predicted phosphodiesterase
VPHLILSDIHSNFEALEAVVADAAGEYDRVVCLGDLAGYGASPNEVIDWMRAHSVATVRGNHDRACLGDEVIEWFNPVAQAAARWTMATLTEENRSWLQSLPQGPLEVDGFRILHGSPLDEDEYLLQVADVEPMASTLGVGVSFFGHTHVQGGFLVDHGRIRRLPRVASGAQALPVELDADVAYLVNPGSVGQPRDGDWRAAYAIYDAPERRLQYRRSAYDVDLAQTRIRGAGLPSILADRLAAGM